MVEALEQSAGQPFRAENFGTFRQGQVACNQRRSPFLALAEHFKEKFGAGLGQRHEAEFIDDK